MGVTGWWIELIANAASTLRSPRAAAVGSRSAPTGTVQPKLKPTVASLNGLMVPTGVVAAGLRRVSFEGATGLEGAADTALRPLAASLNSAQVFTGTATTSLQSATAALAGTQTQSGSIGATVAKATSAAAGTQATAGVQFISAAATVGGGTGSNVTLTLGAHAAGDLLLAWCFRDSTVAPGLPAGWTQIINMSSASCQSRLAWKVAASSSETSGTWADANALLILAYRNAEYVSFANNFGTSSTINYSALTRTVTDGTAWVVRLAAHRTATNLLTNTPVGYTARAGIATELRGIDSNGPVASDPTAATQSVNASSGWHSITVEIAPP